MITKCEQLAKRPDQLLKHFVRNKIIQPWYVLPACLQFLWIQLPSFTSAEATDLSQSLLRLSISSLIGSNVNSSRFFSVRLSARYILFSSEYPRSDDVLFLRFFLAPYNLSFTDRLVNFTMIGDGLTFFPYIWFSLGKSMAY